MSRRSGVGRGEVSVEGGVSEERLSGLGITDEEDGLVEQVQEEKLQREQIGTD